MGAIQVLQVGLGPLGQKITGYLLDRPSYAVTAAVDLDPEKVGKDVGALCGREALGVKVSASLDETVANAKPDVAVVTTVSSMERITPQLQAIVSKGLPVVSSCEELSFPWTTAPALAKQVDDAAQANNVAVLGTGVNPGFLMDIFPITVTAVCQSVERIRVSRIQDASSRRIPFQKKIGAGLTLEQFEAKKQEGTLRHVGLTESVHMIASRMGWTLDRTEDVLSPIVAEHEIASNAMTVQKGQAAGVQQIGRGLVKGEERITLLFRAAIGEPAPRDEIEVQGTPAIRSVIPGGVNGDIATCAITINAIPAVLKAPPGLRTMADIAAVSFCEAL